MLATVCFYFVLLLLMIRYWRYSFLQYKYIYEDMAYMDEHQTEKAESKKAGHKEKKK